MSELRIAAVQKPFDVPAAAREAVRFLTRADAMGLLPAADALTVLDLAGVRSVASGMSAAGIAPAVATELGSAKGSEPARVATILRAANEALDASPLPEREWPRLLAIFGADDLAVLLRISPVSVRRYAARTRTTPDDVAARLHFLALVVGELAGAYNELGIRRWLRRARGTLGGRSPAALLGANWDPDDDGPRRVRAVAASVFSSPAT